MCVCACVCVYELVMLTRYMYRCGGGQVWVERVGRLLLAQQVWRKRVGLTDTQQQQQQEEQLLRRARDLFGCSVCRASRLPPPLFCY